MSSSDIEVDELDGYKPTTPAAKLAAKAKRVAPSKPASHNGKTTAGAAASKAKALSSKRSQIAPLSTDETDEMDVKEATVVPTIKGKKKAEAETIDLVDSEDERAPKASSRTTRKHIATLPSPSPEADPRVSTLERENERLEKQLEEAFAREKDVQTAFESLRESTEAQRVEIQRQIAELQSLLAAKDDKYEILEAEMKRSATSTILSSSKSELTYFVSRDAVEKEQRVLRTRLEEVSATLAEKEKHIASLGANQREQRSLQNRLEEAVTALAAKDKRIATLEEDLRVVTLERDGEIKRANQLQKAVKAHRNGSRSHESNIVVNHGTDHGALHGAAIRFYEETTNLLITSIRETHSEVKPGSIDYAYNCIFTPRDQDTFEALMSLNFTIEQSWVLADEGPMLDVRYTPLMLDKERPEVVERIDEALRDSMRFDHDQMFVFMSALQDLRKSLSPQEDEETSSMKE